jgi:transposase
VLGQGEAISLHQSRAFQAMLSDLCDRTYSQGLILDNELINRRDLTSQGAKARRELIEAMLERSHQARLGFKGYGPEVTMYESVLRATGIHRSEQSEWGLYPPQRGAGVGTVWEAIAEFCFEAKDKPQTLDRLYEHLESPPYGVKQGVIPVLVAAVLLYYLDEVSVYKDGTFVPVLGLSILNC